MRIGLAQINTTVGDFKGNVQKILGTVAEARTLGVDLQTFLELAICFYLPEDLMFKPRFIEENLGVLEEVIINVSASPYHFGRDRRLALMVFMPWVIPVSRSVRLRLV